MTFLDGLLSELAPMGVDIRIRSTGDATVIYIVAGHGPTVEYMPVMKIEHAEHAELAAGRNHELVQRIYNRTKAAMLAFCEYPERVQR